MGTKRYPFPHRADVTVVCDRLHAELVAHSAAQGMTLVRVSDREFRLHRTGAQLTFIVSDGELAVLGTLGFLAEPFRGQLEKGLQEGMPRLLRRCEEYDPPGT